MPNFLFPSERWKSSTLHLHPHNDAWWPGLCFEGVVEKIQLKVFVRHTHTTTSQLQKHIKIPRKNSSLKSEQQQQQQTRKFKRLARLSKHNLEEECANVTGALTDFPFFCLLRGSSKKCNCVRGERLCEERVKNVSRKMWHTHSTGERWRKELANEGGKRGRPPEGLLKTAQGTHKVL